MIRGAQSIGSLLGGIGRIAGGSRLCGGAPVAAPLYPGVLSLARNCPASVDDEDSRKQLGYTARPLEESIEDTITWFRQNGNLG